MFLIANISHHIKSTREHQKTKAVGEITALFALIESNVQDFVFSNRLGGTPFLPRQAQSIREEMVFKI
jgi:hypothetical protein